MDIFKRFTKAFSENSQPAKKDNLPAVREQASIIESLLIPEPTKSLLWTTSEDVSKIENARAIRIVADGDNYYREENGFYSEPSLIWTQLPIKPNTELIQEAMYWPSYSSLSPTTRYQYLRWLGDITQPTNLSYVFLYFYGLERHLLVGEYDKAVDEIARLLKAHTQSSFVRYASQSLIIASLAKKRLDIVDRVPSLLGEEIDEALALRVIKGTTMTPDDIIDISYKVGFKNRRYIKLYPDVFKEELQKQINEYENQFGNLLSTFKLDDFEKIETTVFANLSIPGHIRNIKIPSIVDDKRFSEGMLKLLQAAHDNVKLRIAEGEIKRQTTVKPARANQLNSGSTITDDEVNNLIKDTDYRGGIIDLHFALMECIKEHYTKRQSGDNYRKAIMYCMAQIRIQEKVSKAFSKEYPGEPLPTHTGYNQLVIILQKEKKFDEAIRLSREAKTGGWNGDWDKRISKLQSSMK